VQLLGLPLSLRDIAEAGGLQPPISLRDMLRSMTLRHFGAVVTTPDPEALSGNVDLTIWADGRFELKVHMHDSGLSDYSFRLGIILRSQSGKSALAFYSQGVAHGTLGAGSPDSDERRTGQLATIRDDFDDFAAGSFTVVREYQNDLLGWIESTFLEIATWVIGYVTLGVPAAAMIFGATLAGEHLDLHLPGELGLAGIILADGAYYLCGAAVFIPVFIAGALVSAALFNRRRLSGDEIAEARTVFADTVPYDKVWVTNLETFEGRWFTNMGIDGSVVIGASSEYEDMVADPGRRQIFIHEMTHVWQITRSPTLAVQCKSAVLRTREAVEGKDAVYGVDPKNLQPWDSYNWEQQGDLIRLAYRDRKAGKPLENRPFERYIVENILTG
jgi:hypothetical protein